MHLLPLLLITFLVLHSPLFKSQRSPYFFAILIEYQTRSSGLSKLQFSYTTAPSESFHRYSQKTIHQVAVSRLILPVVRTSSQSTFILQPSRNERPI